MNPYGNIRESISNNNGNIPNMYNLSSNIGNGQMANQIANYSSAQQQQYYYGNPLTYSQPQVYPSNVSMLPHNKPNMQSMPRMLQQTNTEDKHKYYKMEQQRKFKNIGNSYKHTSIDSMLSSIVGSSNKTVTTPQNKQVEEDDFGDFLQAATTTHPSDQPELNKQNVIIDGNIAHDGTTKPVECVGISANLSSVAGASPITHNMCNSPQSPSINLQSKMMASLDLNAPQQAYRKFQPVQVNPGKRYQAKTYQASTKSANWSSISVEENTFHVEETFGSFVQSSSTSMQNVEAASHNVDNMMISSHVDNSGLQSIFTSETDDSEIINSVSWISDVNKIPLVYKHVHEACVASDGMMDTSKLHPILLQCKLPNEILANLWSQANQTVPGRLTQKELYVLLALVALSQNGERNLDVQSVLKFPFPPIPVLDAYEQIHVHNVKENMNIDNQVETVLTGISDDTNIEEDDFQEFQFISTQPAMADVTENKKNKLNGIFPSHDTSEFLAMSSSNDNVNSTPTSVVTNISNSLNFSSLINSPKVTALETVKRPEIVLNTDNDTTPTNTTEFSNINNHLTMHLPRENASSNTDTVGGDKYAVFGSLNEELMRTPNDGSPASTMQAQPTRFYPELQPPTYSSIFSNSKQPDDTVSSTMDDVLNDAARPPTIFVGSADQNFDDTRKPMYEYDFSAQHDIKTSTCNPKHDRFAALQSESHKSDNLSVQSDDNSVKSLELNSISHAIMQQSIGVINTNSLDKSNNSPKELKSPVRGFTDSYGDDDYDFGAYCEPPPDMPPDSYDEEFDVFQEGNSTLTEFDAFSHFETTSSNTQTPSINNAASQSSSHSNPNANMKSFELEEIERKEDKYESVNDDVKEEIKSNDDQPHDGAISSLAETNYKIATKEYADDDASITVDEHNDIIHNNNHSPESIELSSDGWQIKPTNVDKNDVYAEQWEKCLSSCSDIISSTNDILSSIESPSVCNEVVYSCKGQRFISDLTEIYGVARRVCSSIHHLKISREKLQFLHKQIELAWNNLLAFCQNATAPELCIDKDDNGLVCGVCLSSTNGSPITYGGIYYHASCANFWINCVDSVLPALELAS